MTALAMDMTSWAIVVGGALVAGFITGFAGFGTVLVASGFWFYALPAPVVPPLLVIASVAGQTVGMIAVRAAFDWRRVAPYLVGAAVGVPLGVLALSHASPALLRFSAGVFLIAYALFQLSRLTRLGIGAWGGRPADGAVGLGGGFLGGFCGLSGPLPLIWLQLRGGPSAEQRATYQPFNLIVLSFACVVMALSGRVGEDVLVLSAILIPLSLFGAWCGVKAYPLMTERGFRRVILLLLIVSGAILILQGV